MRWHVLLALMHSVNIYSALIHQLLVLAVGQDNLKDATDLEAPFAQIPQQLLLNHLIP